MVRVNYLNNRDLLREIHKSKNSFCSYISNEDTQYDIILPNLSKINRNTIAQAKKNRADRLTREAWEVGLKVDPKVKQEQFRVDYKKIQKIELVFRIMTFDHIPLEPGRKKTPKITSDHHVKVNFPPFQHYRLDENDQPYCIGKSHWVGGMQNGYFSKEQGKISNELARMFMKLCERYGTRSNWRGYCVDEKTESLTKRGWLTYDQINENDTILSYNGQNLTWSSIKSIFRDHNFDGLMHYLTSRSIDSLITPNHKIVTKQGLKPVELLKSSDNIIVMGDEEQGNDKEIYSDKLVELIGWIVTEGNYDIGKDKNIRSIRIYQNQGLKADRIRNCLNSLNIKFSESNSKNICFLLCRKDSKEIFNMLPKKNLTMDFILSLTSKQRHLLLNTMIDGDGWKRKDNKSYVQKSKEHIDLFQTLVTLTGQKSNIHYVENHPSFNKFTNFYIVNIFSKRGNTTRGECLDMHGGLNNGRKDGMIGKGKINHQNKPTTHYKGTVWCPETEYGCFVARRNGKVYLTGNTYNDEMRSQALLQLSQVGLQFDESKSANPFAYYTATITNSFTRVLNIEKKNQGIRDDILEMNNMNPSNTRQNSWGSSEN